MYAMGCVLYTTGITVIQGRLVRFDTGGTQLWSHSLRLGARGIPTCRGYCYQARPLET